MLYETVRLALQAILRNAFRSFLTVLGIVIGVAAVIAMVTVGQGSTDQVQADVSTLGTNLLMVRPGQPSHGPGSGVGGTAPALTLKDVDAIEEQIPSVAVATPSNSRAITAIAGNVNYTTTVTGTDNRFLVARDWSLASGREFYESELRSGASACILGETVRQKLFGHSDPVGVNIRLKQISCRVIGVLSVKGASSFGSDQDDIVLIPIRAFQRRIGGSQDVSMIYASIRNGISTDKAKGDIERLMRERRHVGPFEEDDFNVFDMKQISSMLTGITSVLTGLLSAVAAVSLLVGGIGIMNIMLVSVTERTREIGIRLAVGATEGQVLLQFLVESIVLSLIGGLLGIMLGLALGLLGTKLLSVPFAPNATLILAAFLFSAVVGIVFGYFPALRAARMDPIEALRHQ
ncbi:ABC transporter permease [Hoeflea olei]|uniref:Multidrug ABC transporter substrate-binding protein n=1 Tax=Hoeflea olei TaxID=1480615 RepID=A0A1C1YQY2_9HYPH|nr:ABC transporter permease [Hoeflea olei]OCW55826.1 multidrug ABC transporter substrate-binding protein [Hoeflea olei]